MTFDSNALQYRIALNTQTQLFMAINAIDERVVGYGVTIERAVDNLKNLI